MRRFLYPLLAFVTSFSTLAFAQAPPTLGPVCYQNTAETIGQGVLIPIPSAQIRICTPGSSQSACAASGGLIGQTMWTDPTKATVQPNPIIADVGGNFYFCTNPTHFAMLIVSGQGNFWTPDLNILNDWSGGGTFNGNVAVDGDLTVNGNVGITGFLDVGGPIQGYLIGNASTATALQNAPATCPAVAGAPGYAYGIQASGDAYCAQLYYQALGANGVGQTPRNQINFTSNFALTDSSSPNRTNVDLASTISSNTSGNAATATTATTAGTAGALTTSPTNCGSGGYAYGISANGDALCKSSTYLVQEMQITSGICTTADGAASVCSFTSPDWPVAFADTNYSISCTTTTPTGSGSAPSLNVFWTSKATDYFGVNLQGGQGSSGGTNTTAEIDCIGVHE